MSRLGFSEEGGKLAIQKTATEFQLSTEVVGFKGKGALGTCEKAPKVKEMKLEKKNTNIVFISRQKHMIHGRHCSLKNIFLVVVLLCPM